MPAEFRPLVPAAAPAAAATQAATRVKVLPGAAGQAQPVSARLAAMPAAPSASDAPPQKAPAVSYQRDGDRLTKIRIQCACGEVIELDCAS
jgi:hypothetical protein